MTSCVSGCQRKRIDSVSTSCNVCVVCMLVYLYVCVSAIRVTFVLHACAHAVGYACVFSRACACAYACVAARMPCIYVMYSVHVCLFVCRVCACVRACTDAMFACDVAWCAVICVCACVAQLNRRQYYPAHL